MADVGIGALRDSLFIMEEEIGMNAFKIKSIVVDLDRTLLRTDKTLSENTVNVLNVCRQKGMKIMVATARPLRTTLPYCDQLKLDAMVVSNGARILCGNRKTEHGIETESAKCLLNALLLNPDLRITLETGDCAYSNKPIADYETVRSENLAEIAGSEGALKILVHMDREDTLERVRQELTDDLYYTVAGGFLIQIMDKRATKWNGIQTMLQIAGITPEETAYFGDDQDDLEPIRLCGMGIAVSNAIEEVKAAADFICGSNDADGVAGFLEKRIS